jgi:hypothetical protein
MLMNKPLKNQKPELVQMAGANHPQPERVRKSSPEQANRAIDQEITENIRLFGYNGTGLVTSRLQELDREWDIEKTLEVNASALALTGLALGTLVNKKWFMLSGVVAAFLLQHGLQGWCPPLPLFRKLGIRTKNEINEERTALKALRGDFREVSPSTTPTQILNKIRRT